MTFYYPRWPLLEIWEVYRKAPMPKFGVAFITVAEGKSNMRYLRGKKNRLLSLLKVMMHTQYPGWLHITKWHNVRPERRDICFFFRKEAKKGQSMKAAKNKARSWHLRSLKTTYVCETMCRAHRSQLSLLRNWKQNSCFSVVLSPGWIALLRISAYHCKDDTLLNQWYSLGILHGTRLRELSQW